MFQFSRTYGQGKVSKNLFFTLFLRILGCLLLHCLSISNAYGQEVLLDICFEDQEQRPYFIGSGPEVPEQAPGLLIELLQQVDKKHNELQVQFHRQSWRKCIADLKEYRADAIFSNFTSEFESFAKFPVGMSDDPHFGEITKTQMCLFTPQKSIFRLSGPRLSETAHKPLMALASYSDFDFLMSKQIPYIKSSNNLKSFEFLYNDNAVGVLTHCEMGNYLLDSFPKYAEVLRRKDPPVQIQPLYLTFSLNFYEDHPELSNRIWESLSHIVETKYRHLKVKYDLYK